MIRKFCKKLSILCHKIIYTNLELFPILHSIIHRDLQILK
jgi:hypothetical protein